MRNIRPTPILLDFLRVNKRRECFEMRFTYITILAYVNIMSTKYHRLLSLFFVGLKMQKYLLNAIKFKRAG